MESPEVVFRSDVTVELVKATAQDSDVVWAARVSTIGEKSIEAATEDAAKSAGLIRYLMRDRHGCYDDQTEVLTGEGWKAWPDVDGTESFATLNAHGDVEYQRAQRLVAKPISGPMISIRATAVDLLVTPDHNMLAERRRQPRRSRWELVPAKDLLEACHRLPMGGASWYGERDEPSDAPRLALLGFFIGDGCFSGTSIEFRLRKEREIDFLRQVTRLAGFALRENGDRFRVIADEDFRLLAKHCYTPDRSKCIPREVLDNYGPNSLSALFSGLMSSDGSIGPKGKETYSTTSWQLTGEIQELAMKIGRAAVVAEHPFTDDDGHYGSLPRYRVTIYRDRNMTPKIGWTTTDRAKQVTVEQYDGTVYCVTVPNGTLYVRRNGKPLWCGNTPFEHNSMTFLISAPIFVFREFHRHRVGWSYNESSARYRELDAVFYVPAAERPLVQEGKPGAYVFVDGTAEQHDVVVEQTKSSCLAAYAAYQEMLNAGVAREVARGVLPVATYSSMYATCNARSLMAFLSLRTKREDSKFPSFPQREIEMVAEKMEAEWAKLMPITHDAFNLSGRVSP